MMYREVGLILVMIVVTRLIVLKFDQQFVVLLKGKLFRQQRDMNAAEAVYQKYKSPLSLISFMVGGATVGVSVILLGNGHGLFPLFAAISLVLLGLGIWGRIRSFRAADHELSELQADV